MYILYVTMVSGLRAYVQVRARVMEGHSAFTPPRLFLAWYLNLTVMYPLSLWHWRFRSVRDLLAFLWFSYGCRMVSLGFPMVVLWLPLVSYGFLLVFLWFSYGFPFDFLRFSYGFPIGFPMVGLAFGLLWFSYGVLMVFQWLSYGCFMFS